MPSPEGTLEVSVTWRDQSPAELLTTVGEWLEGIGQLEQAARYYFAATTISPDDALAFYRLGKLRLRQAEYALACDALSRAVQLTPDHAPTWYHLAHAYFHLQDYAQADTAAQHALQLDPDHAGAYLIRLRVAQQRGDMESIKALLARVPAALKNAAEVRQMAQRL